MSKLNFEKAFFGEPFISEWEMTDFERVVFTGLVERLRPKRALEIGTRQGGSLQILTRYCDHVISLDVDPSVPERLAKRFPQVDFYTGDSQIELPRLLQTFQEKNQPADFIFIDGDHTREGARRDLMHTLSITPSVRTWVLMHDTFNPEVRAGIRALPFATYPHLHVAALDFAPGILLSRGPLKGEIWGGFALFILDPEVRTEELNYSEEWQNLWELAQQTEITA